MSLRGRNFFCSENYSVYVLQQDLNRKPGENIASREKQCFVSKSFEYNGVETNRVVLCIERIRNFFLKKTRFSGKGIYEAKLKNLNLPEIEMLWKWKLYLKKRLLLLKGRHGWPQFEANKRKNWRKNALHSGKLFNSGKNGNLPLRGGT